MEKRLNGSYLREGNFRLLRLSQTTYKVTQKQRESLRVTTTPLHVRNLVLSTKIYNKVLIEENRITNKNKYDDHLPEPGVSIYIFRVIVYHLLSPFFWRVYICSRLDKYHFYFYLTFNKKTMEQSIVGLLFSNLPERFVDLTLQAS